MYGKDYYTRFPVQFLLIHLLNTLNQFIDVALEVG